MNWITGIPVLGDLIKVVFGDQEKKDQYQADARADVYSQFAAEFGHSKTWWDSLIDGLNRLPRPFMTFGTIYLFAYCWVSPEDFIKGATALQAMPKEGWYILAAIVTFWFAAKLPKDFGKFKAPKIKEIKQEIQDTSFEDPQEGIEWEERVQHRYNG